MLLSRMNRTLVSVAAAALASGIHAAGLFLPAGPASAIADVAPMAKAAPARRSAATVPDAWERRVRVARHELAAARADVEGTGAGRLLLNVRDGVRLDVAVERTAPTMFGYSLSGRVAGGAAQVGFVTLVVHDEAVAGSIWTPDATYELSYLGGGVHALRDVTNAPPVECGGAVPAESSALDTAVQASPDDTDYGSVVDVLVVWTPAAEEEVGGEASILSVIDFDFAYANDAFERSGALVSLNLVGAERVDYLQTDIRADLARLATPDDGHMDRVHHLRDALGADLVHLRAADYDYEGAGAQGIAYSPGAFSINALAHEVGHNFGLLHDRGDSFVQAGYNYGFTTVSCQGTIMSYGTGCPPGSPSAPYYASPWRHVPNAGRVLGVSRFSKKRGLHGPADAVLTLNRNRHWIANLRPSRNGE